MAEAGSSIFKEILAAGSPSAREAVIQKHLDAGHWPSWTFKWRPIRVSAVVDGKPYTLEYLVMPDYLALGHDDDYFWVPLVPTTIQKLADKQHALMPSTRIVNEVFANSSARLLPQPVSPNTASVRDWARHSIQAQQQMKTLGVAPGTFVDGHKKTVVTGPNLDGSRVAIYGWHDESGKLTQGRANAPIQPYSTIHEAAYDDYSHGTRLVRREAYLNGQPVDLRDLFVDPKLHVLVSSQGPFEPHFPSTGSGAFQQAARTSFGFPSTSSPEASAASAASSLFKTGDDVRAAQLTLIALGYNLGPAGADGKLGPKTTQALQAFQVKEGLPKTGTLDPKTKEKLQAHAERLGKGKALQTAKTVGLVALAGGALAGAVALVKHMFSSRLPTRSP